MPSCDRILDLSCSGVVDDDLAPRHDSPLADVETCTRLELYDNRIGNRGLGFLAPRLTRVRQLWLGHNRIGDGGVRVLARVAHMPSLAHLFLDDNRIGTQGAAHLLAALDASRWPALDRLGLHTNRIDGPDVARALHARGLSVLWLDHNPLPARVKRELRIR
jgi:hypothetical protein